MSWAEEFADRMAALKLTGWPFERCWSVAILENPPDWRKDFGIRGHWFTGTLEGMLEEQRTEAWLREVYRAAWEGEASKLIHLEAALIVVEKPGRRTGRSRGAYFTADAA